MARYTDAVCRICRREGLKLFLKGSRCYTKKCAFERRATPPGMYAQRRRKVSEYGLQLREKQKVRKSYSVLEKQFQQLLRQGGEAEGHDGREPAPHARDATRQRRVPDGPRHEPRPGAPAGEPRPLRGKWPPDQHPELRDERRRPHRGSREPPRPRAVQDDHRNDEVCPDPRLGELGPGRSCRARSSPSRRASRCRSSSTSSSSSSTTRDSTGNERFADD